MPGVTGLTVGKVIFPRDGITVNQNQDLFFQAEDKDGNIIATNAVFINGINVLNPDDFVVDFDFKGSLVYITPKIVSKYGLGSIHYSVYLDIDNITDLKLTNYIKGFETDKPLNNGLNIDLHAGNSYILHNNSSFDKKDLSLLFRVKNIVTGETVVSKRYDISLRGVLGVTDEEGVSGGVINPGQDNEQVMTPDNDKNITNKGDNLSIDWNFNNAKDSVKSFFSTALEFFNMILYFLNQFPDWIVIPLYTLFMLAIVVFVFHVIRG